MRLLVREGFRILEASSGAAALEVLARGELVDLLLTDVAMPEMSGVELAAKVRELCPQVPVVYVSGYFDDPGIPSDVEAKRAWLLPKPFTRALLMSTVTETLVSVRAGGLGGHAA